jgi:AcrR family transcriptional regulator
MQRLSPKQREIRERDEAILRCARELLLERGYFGITMDLIAEASECPKGTMYQRFGCKEDIVLALALGCLQERAEMMRRASAFEGRSRERVIAMGEAVTLYARLHPQDSQILHAATGPVREKATPHRLSALTQMENQSIDFLRSILRDAVLEGDLTLSGGATIEELAFVIWGLVEGCFTLIEAGVPQAVLGLGDPFSRMFRGFNVMADGYGWRPLFAEWDWEETLANVRRSVFPEETQQLHGAGQWYGDRA